MKFSTFVRQATLIKNRLAKLLETINSFFTDTGLNVETTVQVLVHLGEVEKKREEFDKVLDRVMGSDDEDFDEDQIAELEQDISNLYAKIRALTNSVRPMRLSSEDSVSDVSAGVKHNNSVASIKLPPLVLKTFDGSPNQWLAFSSLYEATVHNNDAISNIQRFQYLLSSVQGPALQLIQNLPITPDNYDVAWNILRQRYQNDRKLLSYHMNNILDLPNISNPSIKNLRSFLSSFGEHSQALLALKLDLTKESPLLATILLRKVDADLRRKFEDSREDTKCLPDVKEFMDFLELECANMEAANLSQSKISSTSNQSNYASHSTNTHSKKPSFTKPSRTVLLSSNHRSTSCIHCKSNDHNVYRCTSFKELTPQDRLQSIQQNKCCTNCLSAMHRSKDCKSENVCNSCKRRHHSLLHLTRSNESSSHADEQHTSENNKTVEKFNQTAKPTHDVLLTSDVTAPVSNVTNERKSTTILLGTCLVKLTSPTGYTAVVRAVVDSASMVTCMTEKCAQILHLDRTHSNTSVDGLSSQPVKTKGRSKINIFSLDGQEVAVQHPVLILDKITSNLPQVMIPNAVKDKFSHLELADPTFNTPRSIDLLLDAGLFSKIMTGERVVLGEDLPVAMNSIFGYLIVGTAPATQLSPSTHCGIVTLLSTLDSDLHRSLHRFWELEEPPHSTKSRPEEEECEKYFRSTFTRNESGSYVVRLPMKKEHPALGNSHGCAKKRFTSLEKQLNSNPPLKERYVEAINDYVNSGHMEPHHGTLPDESKHFFLPHLAVVKEESTTTKLRVVFDASARSSTSVSLNDILSPGPKLQNNICDVLQHFRRHPIIMSSDIQKMFRQIFLHADDRNYLLLLWRENDTKPIETYKLTTVTFGLNCSPYLAIRTLQQLVEDEGHKYPNAAKALKSQVYVDDIFLGAETVESALKLQQEVISLLAEGGFKLRKWTSNSPELLTTVPEEHRETPINFNDSERLFNVLGIKWIPETDNFAFNFTGLTQTAKPITKRSVLSAIGQIYDPCGWLSPVTFWAKALMQHLWTLGIQWDEPLPSELSEMWSDYVAQLPLINDIRISRYLDLTSATDIQIHGFCDASESGFAATVYLRCVNKSNVTTVHMLIAKSRVAPLKRVSIPRLELCGAHLLAKLIDYCMKIFSHNYEITARAWCDSTVALAWIKTAPYKLKTFVANRVSQIQDWVPPHLWSHVSTHDNPADCASRGLKPDTLKSHQLWFSGPPWLLEPPNSWPISSSTPMEPETLSEIKQEPFPVLVNEVTSEWDLLTKYSSWSLLIRVMSYVIRFVKKLKKENANNGPLKIQELDATSKIVCKIIQQTQFKDDLKELRSKEPKCSTRLQRLSPFLDDFGLIRVGGRIQSSELPFAAKHPIILPKSHPVVNLLIDYFHIKYLHVGPKHLQAIISQQFWILSARDIIRSRIFKCIKCFRCRPQGMTQKMGNLPKQRITPTKVFDNCGVDYLGPLLIKPNALRKCTTIKVYLCLFVCLAVKAVHIEVVTSLSTEAYLAALTRFISRRGLSSNIYSDNGTNFVGAASEMARIVKTILGKEDSKEQIHRFATENRINFHFIPPAAPHQGGLWERSVRSVKHHLKRVIGDQLLTLEELNTLAIRTEAMLNSRPLTPLSQDPSELDCLTPGHFLIGGPLIAPPELDWKEVPMNRLSRWQLVQSLSQSLWKKWSLEYLHTLQQRSKWTKTQPNLKKGDLVLIHDHQSPPLCWKMGRVDSVSPGADGLVRVVHLQTAKGPLTRAVTKVSLLPLDQ